MFREISIEKYRGLHNITFSGLGQINILVGDNNSGKTSILEAIQLFSDKDVLTNMIAIARKGKYLWHLWEETDCSHLMRFYILFLCIMNNLRKYM